MATVNVSSAAQLDAALASARGGDVIRLASGNYGAITIEGRSYAGDVTITSANPGAAAVFNDVTVRNVSNLAFSNVNFEGAAGRTSGDLVTVTGSRGITISNADFEGYNIGGVQNGLSVTNSSDIQLSGSELADFYYGAGFRKVDNLRILSNDVHSMDFDGLRLAQVTNVLIQGNRLHDMDGPVDGGHRDMIQFWTAQTDAPSANVTIRDNVLDIGDGRMIQSLFIYNEAVVREGKGAAMYYRNFLIEDNRIEGVHPHGIYVGETNGLTIRDNVVVKDPTSGAYKQGWEPVIEVVPRSTGVTITGNTTHEIVPGSNPGWNVSGNKLVPLNYVPGTPAPGPQPAVPTTPSVPSPSPTGGTGTAGADSLVGGSGADMLRGLAGNDRLLGAGGRDILTGGTGGDVFDFDVASHSVGAYRDVLRGGDGGKSFDAAGAAAGDRIDVSSIDANALAAGNQGFGWGGTGIGRISAIDLSNSSTLVRANTDNDAAFEFELVIEDAGTRAAQYTAADFML